MENEVLHQRAQKVRQHVLEAVYSAASGHPGGSLSICDVLTYLYFEELHINPQAPDEPNRDRFVLSKGHCSPALYGALAERGFFPVEDLKTFRQIDSYLQGHPSMKDVPGVDMSTGSLGQGFSAACGMAIAAKKAAASYCVYTILGDGELEEGQVWEAAMFAAHYKLDNLCALVDFNGLQIDGAIDQVLSPNPIDKKFEAFGWNVVHIDAHDFDSIRSGYGQARQCKDRPTLLLAKSVKGKGVSFMENQAGWHGAAPKQEQYEQAMAELGGNA